LKNTNKKISKIKNEKIVDMTVLSIIKKAGLSPDFDNYIFYDHKNQLCFLWRNWPEYTYKTVEKVEKAVKLWNDINNGITAVIDEKALLISKDNINIIIKE
jgi:hypothetical protein